MALKKSHTTDSGIPLTVYRIQPGRFEPIERRASFIIHGYANENIAQHRPTMQPLFGKLRLEGDAFDKYLSKAVLKRAAKEDGKDMYALLYEALKDPKLPAGCFISYDERLAGPNFFADAEDV